MFLCPECREPLRALRKPAGVYYSCSACGGRAVGMSVVRKSVVKPALDAVWQAAGQGWENPARPCPACRRPLRVARHDALELDICRRCHLLWFDAGERERMPARPDAPVAPALSDKARASIALVEVERIRASARPEGPFGVEAPDAWWKWVPALFGLPVEQEAHPLARLPLVAWGGAAFLAILAFGLAGVYDAVVARFGFLADAPWRQAGATLLLYAVLPASLGHGLFNAWFLAVFGDNVEDELGHRRFALLFILCALASSAAHALAQPANAAPLVGAQGALAGVMIFYSLRFPHARIALFLRGGFRQNWLTLPAWFVFLLWGVLQALAGGGGLAGWADTSSASYLGGLFAGLWLWHAWRDA